MLHFLLLALFSHGLCGSISPKHSKIWGPGLSPSKIVMPARYFFIEARDEANNRINSVQNNFKITVEGSTKDGKPCRIWTNTLDRKDGSYIIRYKIFEKCSNLKIQVLYSGHNVAKSPYEISETILPDQCNCPQFSLENMLEEWKCGEVPRQIIDDLNVFKSDIDWDILREKVIETYDKPYSISLCHYIIKNNELYRRCYGQYVGFKMFMDSLLLSLIRKIKLPDIEFFVNLGDWPLVQKAINQTFPIFSWCGSTDSYDIVMPTYDITESTLENMGKVMLDMLSVQGNTPLSWKERIPAAFWRGRDSSRERLKLIEISRQHPDLFNCSLTNFFFFRDEEEVYGPKVDHVSFYTFFNYKYQLGLDGTVAAYRFPYLLAGNSLVFKQASKYYEHFYNNLKPYIHYVPIKRNLEDLVEKIQWALENDSEAKKIAENGSHLLHEFSKKISSPVKILENMEKVAQPKQENCDCSKNLKDEL